MYYDVEVLENLFNYLRVIKNVEKISLVMIGGECYALTIKTLSSGEMVTCRSVDELIQEREAFIADWLE